MWTDTELILKFKLQAVDHNSLEYIWKRCHQNLCFKIILTKIWDFGGMSFVLDISHVYTEICLICVSNSKYQNMGAWNSNINDKKI